MHKIFIEQKNSIFHSISIMFLFPVEQIWDDVPTKPEIESKPNELRIPDILTKVATDANEGNRYVTFNLIKFFRLNSKKPRHWIQLI